MGKISMESRNEIIENKKAMYQRGTKTGKTKLLNELVSITGIFPDHVSRRLQMLKAKKKHSATSSAKQGRKARYGMSHKQTFFLYGKRRIIPT